MRVSKGSLAVLTVGLLLTGAGIAMLVSSGGDEATTTTVRTETVSTGPTQEQREAFVDYCTNNANASTYEGAPGSASPAECQDYYEWKQAAGVSATDYPGYVPPDFEIPGAASSTDGDPSEGNPGSPGSTTTPNYPDSDPSQCSDGEVWTGAGAGCVDEDAVGTPEALP